MRNKKTCPALAASLYDIDGNLLFAASRRISRKIVYDLVKTNHTPCSEIYLSETCIANDMLTSINTDTYKEIFFDKDILDQLYSIIAQTKISEPIIKELQALKAIIPLTYRHILIVSALSIKISLQLKDEGYDPFTTASIGIVHDLGKSRLPAGILEKTTPLTHEEFSIIQTHPIIEYILISWYAQNKNTHIAKTSFSHHERLDGSGYPRGIRHLSKHIQLIIPCDIFDALISHRPYRSDPYSVRAALDVLLQEAKLGRINKKFVLYLISNLRKDKPRLKEIKLSEQWRDAPPLVNHYGVRIH